MTEVVILSPRKKLKKLQNYSYCSNAPMTLSNFSLNTEKYILFIDAIVDQKFLYLMHFINVGEQPHFSVFVLSLQIRADRQHLADFSNWSFFQIVNLLQSLC